MRKLLLKMILDLEKCPNQKMALSCIIWFGHFMRS